MDETSALVANSGAAKEKKQSPWMDRFVTILVTLGAVSAVFFFLFNGSNSTNLVREQESSSKITYRPICKVPSSGRSIQVLQTSLAEPTEHWAPQECVETVANADVNHYASPDAVLQTDLSSPALPHRPPILGFGGAFTEASALNFKSLPHEGQEAVLELLFGKGEHGLGYTLGRVHINSCDFSVASYAYDNVEDDFNLDHFSIQHDVDAGMVDFMQRAKKVYDKAWKSNMDESNDEVFKFYASPWSPPAWMKAPTPDDFDNATHAATMTNSAQPTCLRDGVGEESQYAKAWALYFTKFLQSYQEDAGLEFYAVTIQNEPEFPAPWEACSYTPETQAMFLANHLGPQLKATFPNTKIFIFDHNKDHMPHWIDTIMGNPKSAPYVAGTAYHWYAGGMDRLLDGAQGTPNMHRTMQKIMTDDDHIILGSEACHCPYTGYGGGDINIAWSRAERYAHTILADLNAGSQGWVEWNFILDSIGGPNHLGNLCDASLLAVPHRAANATTTTSTHAPFEHHFKKNRFGTVVGDGRTREELEAVGINAHFLDQGVVVQPMFYYMGHISRHVRPGSRPVFASVESSSVDESGQTFRLEDGVAGGGRNDLARTGIELTAWPCEGSTRQQFVFDNENNNQIQVLGHDWLGAPSKSCIRNRNDKDFLGVLLGTCNATASAAVGSFEIIDQQHDDVVQIVVTNAKHHKSCLVVQELANGGGASGPRSGAQVAIGSCDEKASLWKFNHKTGEIVSSYYAGGDVCMTTGWPFLQMGAFDTPTTGSSKTVVILNEAGQTANYVLKDKEEVVMTGSIPGHSIQTVLID